MRQVVVEGREVHSGGEGGASVRDPLVSVLIAAHNEEDNIRDALDSVREQTYPHLEIVVVDDGSTDATAEIVRSEYPDVVLVQRENRGASAARNTAAENASGELLMTLDADDRMRPEKAARQVELLRQNPDAAAVATNAVAYSGVHTYPYTNPRLPRLTELTLHHVLCGPCPVGPSMMIRAEVFDAVGGYDQDIRFGEDSDLFCRVMLHGHKLLFLNEPLYLKKHHPANMSSRSFVERAGDYVTWYKRLDPRRTDLPWSSPLSEADYSWYLTERVILAAVKACWDGAREAGMLYLEEIDHLPAAPPPARALRRIARASWPAFGVAALPYYLWLRAARTRRVWGITQGLLQIWRRFIR